VKIKFFSTNLDAKYLGLEATDYDTLTQVVGHIVHNAWPMDFQRNLRSSEPQIRAVSELIDFSMRYQKEVAHLALRSIFISSIAIGARSPSTVLTEAPISDPKDTAILGYLNKRLNVIEIVSSRPNVSG
jgi:thioester reductase-like protein